VTGSRVLIVRLPCKKIYPIGPVYLAALLQQAAPHLAIRLLDLSLFDVSKRRLLLRNVIQDFRPDAIAFSWRDIQVFSPHDMDEAMRSAFTFFYDSSLLQKAGAAFKGLASILSYRNAFVDNLSLIGEALRLAPSSLVAVGGPSIRVFGDLLRPRIPAEVHLMSDPDQFLSLLGLPPSADPVEPSINHALLEKAFPQWAAYKNEVIGIQTKRGCSQNCLFCLYPFLEGNRIHRRDPALVVDEIENYYRRWGCRRFWFVDAQLLSEAQDEVHFGEILEAIAERQIDLTWSGYARIDALKPEMARLMVKTGLTDFEIALNSGAQSVLDGLRMGFTAEGVLEGFRVLKSAGYCGRVLVDLSLNAPGETYDTLRETLEVLEKIAEIFGRDRVTPVMFFLAIQPHTGLEKKALRDGYLKKGYDPLSVWPWDIRTLIYNPPPLGAPIGRCCARAFRGPKEETGNTILSMLSAELRKQ
jgi:hypothetical protein